MGQGVLGIDEGVEDLVIVRGGKIEQLADRLFLGPRVLPPLPLERQYLLVAGVQPGICGCPAHARAVRGKSGGIPRERVFLRCFGHDTLLVDFRKDWLDPVKIQSHATAE